MAKMFYTMEEVCEKLEKSEDEVREMVSSGQIQEFRDRDKLMFKVDQIDLLAGGDEDTSEVHLELEDTSGGSGLGLSGSGIPLSDSREASGISVFDTDHGMEEQDIGSESGSGAGMASDSGSAFAIEAGAGADDDLNLEDVGSGSGLLDLTKESDETSLGADLLEDVMSGEDDMEIPANASGLFEAASTETTHEEVTAASGVSTMPMVIEAYDGAGSGLGVGMMLGAMAALVVLAMIVAVGVMGGTPDLAMQMAGNIWIWVGALAGAVVIFGLIGLFIGKSTE
jgi:hypothetical protein